MKVNERQKVQDKRQKFKKFYLIALPFLLLSMIIVGLVVSIGLYQAYAREYRDDMSLAQNGVQHLQRAATLLKSLPQHPLEADEISQAKHEFTAASAVFVQLDHELKSLPGVIAYTPTYNVRLSAASHLVSIAVGLSQAGLVGCDALSLIISRFHDPLDTRHGLTTGDLAIVSADLHQVKSLLNLALEQVNSFRPADLQFDTRIGKLVASFHKDIPALGKWLDEAQKVLTVAPTILGIGIPTNYLIEVLDSSELRPGGGFIGNYGIATFSGGRLIAAHITDAYLLDGAFEATGKSISYPAAYRWFDLARASWSFRDSNLDADFPTAARYGEQNYMREGGNVSVQGVIAITPALIQHALAITGPIDVPEYHEAVTAQNLVDRIHYHQLGVAGEGSSFIPSPGGHSSERKRFTELLSEHFLARVRQLPPGSFSRFLQLTVSSIGSKDLQVYFNSPIAESLLQGFHLDAAIHPSADDSLFIVNANISPNKANSYINDTLDDQVTIDAEGSAIHHTTIRYRWVTQGPIYGGDPLYRDYMRVYVPPGSILEAQDGWQPDGKSEAFGHEVWAGFFTLQYGQIRTITLTWMVPDAAKKEASGWHYQYEIQRQAGAQWKLHLQISLPSCAAIKSMWGGLVSPDRRISTLSQSLNEDMNLGIDYVC